MFYKLLKKIKNIGKKNDNSKRSIVLNGKACLVHNKNKYDEIISINQAEFKIFSQNGEDGIIDYLFYKISIQDAKYVEIGVENYEEANTRFLYESSNAQGLIIDNSFDLEEINSNFEVWKGRLKVEKNFVTTKNIHSLLEKHNFDKNLDLFSIDIDGIDYWIIKELPRKISKIFIAEFNPVFGSELEISVPNIDDFNRTDYHFSNLCWGMSLRALINLMQKKGYLFLGTNLLRNNAFFVTKDYEKQFIQILNKIDFQNLYKFTDHNFMESRDENGKLSYVKKNQQLNIIKNCEVIDLSNENKGLVKIKELS